MELHLNSGEIWLAENHPVCLRQAAGREIRCTAGTLWITETGEPTDIFLNAGERHRIVSNGLTVLEAIGHGRFRLADSARGVSAKPAIALDANRLLMA